MRKSVTDSPTRTASARAMFGPRLLLSPFFSMNKPAAASAPMMQIKPIRIMIFMALVYAFGHCGGLKA